MEKNAVVYVLKETGRTVRSQTHTLKANAPYYDAMERGEKNFEIRRDDRGFQKGDILEIQRCTEQGRVLSAWSVDMDFNGKPLHVLYRKITYVLTGGQFEIEPGWVILSLEPVVIATLSEEEGGK